MPEANCMFGPLMIFGVMNELTQYHNVFQLVLAVIEILKPFNRRWALHSNDDASAARLLPANQILRQVTQRIGTKPYGGSLVIADMFYDDQSLVDFSEMQPTVPHERCPMLFDLKIQTTPCSYVLICSRMKISSHFDPHFRQINRLITSEPGLVHTGLQQVGSPMIRRPDEANAAV
ncbi:hypothetical protein OUZ56_025584 [Daphnia magna]|uniref:Uncharacterized protein n=1 Tax=Daphnia magna TaxID=35525 RepID=A0ABQ9ZK94_9CRUS|nr:hypothetical protein OUZ56_025584 [Daphnia magna]